MKDQASKFSEFISKESNQKLLEQEGLILSATELICRLMEDQSMSKADLAKKLGKSRSYITQILDGSRNLTLQSFAELAFCLGHRIEFSATQLCDVKDDGGYAPRFEFKKPAHKQLWQSPKERMVEAAEEPDISVA